MNVRPGSILVSTPLLNETVFEKKVILLAEYNLQGALGFVINTVFPRRLNELTEFSNCKNWLLFNGGPVAGESLFFIHRRPDIIAGGSPINNTAFLGGDFKTAIHSLENGMITPADIKLFIGYCGWDAGEPEAEIAEGSWTISPAGIDLAFENNISGLWERLQ